ncbi:MAG: response regulator [Acidobacteria bacterium]|nr:response regulator [Acidobacteriota bacterium]
MATRLDREQLELAQTVHRSAASLLDLLNDILDFSKMNAGKLEFANSDFRLREVIEDVLDILSSRALEKGLDIGYTIHPAVPEWLSGDQGRLRQVIMNLVGNAIKFSGSAPWPNGGDVRVRVERVGYTETESTIAVSVTDQGVGLDESVRQLLFQPFTQADSSNARRFGGTGLGLAISRQLVEAMSGEIGVNSEPGKGARFWFRIQLGNPAGTHPPPPGLSSWEILILDTPCSAETIRGILGPKCVMVQSVDDPEIESRSWDVAFVHAQADLAELRKRLRGTPIVLVFNKNESIGESTEIAVTRPVRAGRLVEALARIQAVGAAPAPASPPRTGGLAGHVLIAEDNPVNQMLAVKLVTNLGLTADVVSDGNAALAAARIKNYDLILMDCQMPGLDGYECTRVLREKPATIGTPIVAMTANAMKGDRDRCLAAGMTDYISKPVSSERLRELLARYLPAAEPL